MSNDQVWLKWRDDIETKLGHMLATDLKMAGARKFYLVLDFESKLPFPGVHGFTFDGFSHRFQEAIGDRFDGHGPGLFIATDTYPFPIDEAKQRATGTVLHEVTHELQRPTPRTYDMEPEAVEDEVPTLEMISRVKTDDALSWESEALGYMIQRRHHGQDFIRRLVLLALMAERNGWSFNRSQLCDWNLITFADFEYFEDCLHDDNLYLMEGRSFAGLSNRPEPVSFRFAYLDHGHMITENYVRQIKATKEWYLAQSIAAETVQR